ncbi:MAG: hypothetical protein Q616_SPPC00665G0001, partial [Streptococcus parasanguinis DORA_23_24]
HQFDDLDSQICEIGEIFYSSEEGKFDAEGGATVNNNLRVVTEDDLKNNKNALQDKKE